MNYLYEDIFTLLVNKLINFSREALIAKVLRPFEYKLFPPESLGIDTKSALNLKYLK